MTKTTTTADEVNDQSSAGTSTSDPTTASIEAAAEKEPLWRREFNRRSKMTDDERKAELDAERAQRDAAKKERADRLTHWKVAENAASAGLWAAVSRLEGAQQHAATGEAILEELIKLKQSDARDIAIAQWVGHVRAYTAAAANDTELVEHREALIEAIHQVEDAKDVPPSLWESAGGVIAGIGVSLLAGLGKRGGE